MDEKNDDLQDNKRRNVTKVDQKVACQVIGVKVFF